MKSKLIISALLLVSLTLSGCANSLAQKSIEAAKTAIETKDYDKALVSLELALDEDKDNEEANKMYTIVESYVDAKILYDEDKIQEAKDKIDNLEKSYENYAIKEDIEALTKEIEEKLKKYEIIDKKLDDLSSLVDSKKYKDAKKLFTEISKEELSEKQKARAYQINIIIDEELLKIEEKKKAEEQARIEAEKQKNKITKERAVELTKEYMRNVGEYMAPIIEVDHESDKEYVVHAYTNMGTHTATTGWYYVDKKTGKVTSMF